MNTPVIIEKVLTGGATYDEITTLPDNVRRVEVQSKDQASVLNIKYSSTGNVWQVALNMVDDTGWLPQVWRNAELHINGTGTALIRYWT